MKVIPFIENPGALAKQRIFEYGSRVVVSAERLQHFQKNFYPQKQKGVFGYFRRKKALNAFNKLSVIFGLANKYQQLYYMAKNQDDAYDAWIIQKPELIYTVELGLVKEEFITAFSYDFSINRYSRKKGEENWQWMLNGLFVPELKSYG